MKSLKCLCSILLFSCTAYLYAEDISVGYYNAIQGTQDSVLKATLHQIIKGGERYVYGSTTYHTMVIPSGLKAI